MQSLDRFASELHNCAVTMKAWGFESEWDSSQTLQSAFKRLLLHLQHTFNDRVNLHSEDSFDTRDKFEAFAEDAPARSGSRFGHILAEAGMTNKRKGSQFGKRRVFSPTCLEEPVCKMKPSTAESCTFCNEAHSLWICRPFQCKTIKGRRTFGIKH